MRSANSQDPWTDETVSNPATAPERASLSYSAEEMELVRGLRTLARIIARAHLRRQEPRSGATSGLSKEGEGRM